MLARGAHSLAESSGSLASLVPRLLAEGAKRPTVDTKKLECVPRTMYAGCASLLGSGVGGQSCSNFVAPTVIMDFRKQGFK